MPPKCFQYLHLDIWHTVQCSAVGISQANQMLSSSEWLYLHCIFILGLSPGLWLHAHCYCAQADLSSWELVQSILPESGESLTLLPFLLSPSPCTPSFAEVGLT